MWIRKEEKGSEGRGMNDGQKLKYARVRGESVYRGKVSISIPGMGLMGVPLVLSLSLDSIHIYIYILFTTCLAPLHSHNILLDYRAEKAFETERHRPQPKTL